MNWITGLLIVFLVAELAGFIYLIYLAWKEFSFTLKDAKRLKEPIESLIQEGKRLQVVLEPFSVRLNQIMGEVQDVIEIGRDTSSQVGALVTAVGGFRSPNVKLAVRYGRDWIQERRTNPIVRKIKRAARNLRKRF